MFPVLKDNFRRYNNLSTQPPIWNKTERTKNRFVSWNVLLQDILKDNERISHKQAVEKAYQEDLLSIPVSPTISSKFGINTGKAATVIIIVICPSIRYTIAKYSGLIRFVEVHMACTLKLPVGIDSFEKNQKEQILLY